ncbi:hypothetical protein [Thalassomonas haliotis]|uniref:Transposase n=1 Tax=Thalassomonas haliotis TaxID=485448 RepID=A0ABY7VEM9_9GAMM|nr:hypothetical protein [Thalassomonas haliotis]WDE12169.1 hypothetical protein H3N35_01390 [Thalassomonas haliotis]
MKHAKLAPQLDAFEANNGFIEIASLELINDMVGGLIDSESILSQLHGSNNTHAGKACLADTI